MEHITKILHKNKLFFTNHQKYTVKMHNCTIFPSNATHFLSRQAVFAPLPFLFSDSTKTSVSRHPSCIFLYFSV